ncbi:MAG: hypothetical protein ACLFWD_13480 [Anaerolineales bacterium]
MKRLISVLVLVMVISLALPLTAFAQDGQDGRVIFGGNFTLELGETMNGDLAVFGGSVVLEEGSVLDGALVVMGGNAVVAGRVTGDVATMGGNIDLLQSSVVQGNIFTLGGNLDVDLGADVQGDVISEDGFDVPFSPRIGPMLRPVIPNIRMDFSPLATILWFGFRTLLLAALAVMVVMFWPLAAERTAQAIVSNPLATGGLGLLTFLVSPIVLIMLTITILLIPVSLIALIVLIVASVFGWIAVGLEVGHRLAASLKWEMHPAASAGLGTLLLTFVVGGIGMIPCIGWIAPFIVASLGLGGVILTRFGSKPYAVSDPVAPEPPAPSKGRKVAKKDEE